MRTSILAALLLAFFAAEARSQPSGSERERVRSVLDSAYYIYTADFGRADSIFASVAGIATRNGWQTELAAAHKYHGIVKFLSGDYAAALEHYQRGLSIYESLGDVGGQAGVLLEMANFFKKRNEIDRALDYLRRGERLSREAGDSVLLSNSLDIQGVIRKDTGEPERAADLFAEVLAIRRAIRDTVGLSYVFDNLGSLAMESGNYTAALAYLDSSIVIRNQLDDRQGVAIVVNNQGEVLLAKGDTAAAIPYLERSLTMSRAVGFTDLQQWTMGLLAESYAATGAYARALEVQRGVQLLKDRIYSESTTRQVAEMQEKYEAEKRQRILASREASLAQRTAWLVAAGLGVLLLSGILAYVVRRAARRRRELRRQAELQLRDDRLRISRDLHDHLGAELGIIASDLGRVAREHRDERIGKITRQVRYAMEQMRETIWAVRLERAGWTDLFARLRTYAGRLGGPPVDFELDASLAELELDPQRVLELYRFGQEALRNAVRHSGSSVLKVRALPESFVVEDRGCGFDVSVQRPGYGLRGLAERAENLGARFILQSGEEGTTVGLDWGEYADHRIVSGEKAMDLRL